MPHDVFISYASKDLRYAEALHQRLRQAGLKVWFDKIRLKPGYNWHDEIEAACEDSRVVLPVLTPRWKESQWTKYETYGAEAIIPTVFEGTWKQVATPPLERFQSDQCRLAKATSQDWARLVQDIRRRVAQPPPQKGAPFVKLHYRPLHDCFVGREAWLIRLHEELHAEPKTSLTEGRIRVVTALGGAGKTTLVRHYAEKFWRCYQQMFWVDCRNDIASQFALLFEKLFPDASAQALRDTDKASRVLWELQQLEKRPSRLLILDDASDEKAVLTWIPQTGNCHVVITSRFTAWSPGIGRCAIWVLDKEAARELLLRRTNRRAGEVDLGACDALAKYLDYLPLALEQAAEYIVNEGPGFGFDACLRLYRSAKRKMLSVLAVGSTECSQPVFTTWVTTIERLPPGGRVLMRLIAFMAPTPIPMAWFVAAGSVLAPLLRTFAPAEAAGDAAPVPDEFQIREWKNAATRYSMLQVERGDAVSMHALVQTVEQLHVPEEEKGRWLQAAMQVLAVSAPRDGYLPEHWAAWKDVLPHIDALLEQGSGVAGFEPDPDLLQAASDFLRVQGRNDQARQLIERAAAVLAGQEQQPGTNGHAQRAQLKCRYRLGILIGLTGNTEHARLLLSATLAEQEMLLGHDHIDTLATVNELGWLLQRMGASDAEVGQYFKRALDGRRRTLPPDHRDTLESLHNVATVMLDSDEQRQLYQQALTGLEQLLGKGHPDTLIVRRHLANSLANHQETLAQAEALLTESLEHGEELLGHDHEEVRDSLERLHELLMQQGKACEAALLEASAKARALGPNHLDVAVAWNNAALEFRKAGRPAEAETYLKRALSIEEGSLPEGDPRVPHRLNNLATVLAMQPRKLSEAIALNVRAWGLQRGSHDLTSARILWLRILLAMLLKRPIQRYVGQLRTLFKRGLLSTTGGITAHASLAGILPVLGKRLSSDHRRFLDALAGVLNDPKQVSTLRRFPAWARPASASLDASWPPLPDGPRRPRTAKPKRPTKRRPRT